MGNGNLTHDVLGVPYRAENESRVQKQLDRVQLALQERNSRGIICSFKVQGVLAQCTLHPQPQSLRLENDQITAASRR